MVRFSAAVAVGLACFWASPVVAQDTALGLRVGTPGLGAEIAIPLGRFFVVRAGATTLPLQLDRSFSGVDYSIDLPDVFGILGIDFIVTERAGLRIGAGALLLPRSVQIVAEPVGTVQIGGNTYPAQSVGRLVGLLNHGNMAPFLIAGIGHPLARGIGLYLDAGAAFLNEPTFSFRYHGLLQVNTDFINDLERERQAVEKEVRDLPRVLPLISIGLRLFAG